MTDPVTGEIVDQKELVERLLAQAREQGVSLAGPGGLLAGLTKQVIETALDAEMTEHLGHDRNESRPGENARDGTRAKTVITEIGPVEIGVPRDRDASFEPWIMRKRQRRLDGIDQIVLSLTARGLTAGEVSAHFAEVYGARVSKDTISKITDKIIEEMAQWANRPLDRVYPVVFIDAIVVKVRDGQVTNRPFYVAVGVTTAGERGILGIWAGDGGEGAKYWLGVLTEIKNRGVEDVCIVVCDGLKGLPESITTTWELATVQTCLIHLVRNTSKFASRKHWARSLAISNPSIRLPMRPQRERDSTSPPGAGRPVSGNPGALGAGPGPVHPVLGLRRRDPPGDLLNQRHRIIERSLPAGGAGQGSLPQRAGRIEMPISGDAFP
jgi:transposase-like protein